MADQGTAPVTDAQPTIKSTASNIIKGIQEKANGRPAAAPPINNAPPAAPADPNAGKEKYVVDGKEVWITPEQRTAWVQKGISFEPKVTQLAHLQNETQQFLKTLSQDPLKILTDKRIGMTPEAVMEKIFASGQISDQMKERVGKWYYENVVEPMKLSPEELEARENKKKLSTYEQQEKSRQENMIKQENQQRVNQAMSQISANISEAMKESGLPNNDTEIGAEMARMVADVMRISHFQRQAITPKQAIEFVKKRIKTVQSAYYDSLEGEALAKELGDVNTEKIKKYLLKLVDGAKPPVISKGTPHALRGSGERKTISNDDFHDYLAELKKQG